MIRPDGNQLQRAAGEFLQLRGTFREIGAMDQHAGLGFRKHAKMFRCREARIQRRADQPCLHAGEIDRHGIEAVG